MNSQPSNIGLVLATICVFTRSVFRAAELSEGFGGALANNEVSFMVLDGAMIMIACGAFTLLHPGYCFTKDGWAAASYTFFKKSEEKIPREQAILDSEEKQFNMDPEVVPTTVTEGNENTHRGATGV